MATSDNGLTDDVHAQLSKERLEGIFGEGAVGRVAELARQAVEGNGPQPARVPDRPAGTAGKAEWVDYVVALGADRDHVTGQSKHWDPAADGQVKAKALTRDELMELAGRLGG